MLDLSPQPGDLEPVETASIDELRALQLERLRWSVRHAYENVPHYRASLDAHGVHPDDVKSLALPVLRHRVLLTPEAEVEGQRVDDRLRGLLQTLPAPVPVAR